MKKIMEPSFKIFLGLRDMPALNKTSMNINVDYNKVIEGLKESHFLLTT
jgi:hypothetical protein